MAPGSLQPTTTHQHNKIEFFIYVSCNPKSFYKDYKKLENNFVISKIILLDQFPLTKDSEIIVLLEKKNI